MSPAARLLYNNPRSGNVTAAVTLIPAGWFNTEEAAVPLPPSVISSYFLQPCVRTTVSFSIRIRDGGEHAENKGIRTTLITRSICFGEMITWYTEPQAAAQAVVKGNFRWSRQSTRKTRGKATGATGKFEQQHISPQPAPHTEHGHSRETGGTPNLRQHAVCVPVSWNPGQAECTGFEFILLLNAEDCYWLNAIVLPQQQKTTTTKIQA